MLLVSSLDNLQWDAYVFSFQEDVDYFEIEQKHANFGVGGAVPPNNGGNDVAWLAKSDITLAKKNTTLVFYSSNIIYSGIFQFCQYLHIGAGIVSLGGDVFRL